MELNISRQETLFIKGIAILFVILSHMGLFDCKRKILLRYS